MPNIKDISGMRFSRLIAINIESRPPIKWLCICNCGNYKSIRSSHLTSGATKSCGCLHKEVVSKDITRISRSGYSSWSGMKTRCYNEKNECFHRYGGRGITVCDRWHDFENFFADMGEKPEGLTLERIDNDGNYTPENCRWATRREQANNTKNTMLITHNGDTLSQAGWARKLGISPASVCLRIKRGLTVDGI